MILAEPALRMAAASVLVMLYAALCSGIWLRERQRLLRAQREAAALADSGNGGIPVLVAYASQTGLAEALARSTAQALHSAGEAVHLCPLNAVDAALLARSQRALFLVSTYGEGNAPDNAGLFQTQHMGAANRQTLTHLRYGLLALGDSQYAHYCGFGRALDAWLQGQGAVPLFPRLEMDNAAPAALAAWQQQIGHIAAVKPEHNAAAWLPQTPFTSWTLLERRQLNPGSAGGAVFHLALQAPPESDAVWESGDLVQVCIPQAPEHPRDYSIASIPADGSVHLLVRQSTREDGTPGLASHWLTAQLAVGDQVPLRLCPHPNFRLADNATNPLILIGNGTGLAGLRSHLRARAAACMQRNWLLFGERNAAYDTLYGEELRAWLASGILQRLDLAFSRDQAERVYVQDLLVQRADSVRQWVQEGAAIYVCGSLQGMAQGVHAALQAALGAQTLAQLTQTGRYRRDVY